jgi:hypothetical protein
MHYGKSQKRGGDFTENRKKGVFFGYAFGENWLLTEHQIQPILLLMLLNF